MVPSLMNWSAREGRGGRYQRGGKGRGEGISGEGEGIRGEGRRYQRGGGKVPEGRDKVSHPLPLPTATLTESGSISKATYLSQCRAL